MPAWMVMLPALPVAPGLLETMAVRFEPSPESRVMSVASTTMLPALPEPLVAALTRPPLATEGDLGLSIVMLPLEPDAEVEEEICPPPLTVMLVAWRWASPPVPRP